MNGPKEIRLAVIGAGNFNEQYHSPALSALRSEYPGLRLCGICDLDKGRADRLCSAFGYEHSYSDYNQMLDTLNVEAVYITVPPSAAAGVVCDVAGRNVPVFLEKPPGVSLAETEKMAEALTAPHMVGFNRRSMPITRTFMELMAGLNGKTFIEGDMYRYNRAENDFLFATGIHAVDMMVFIGGRVNEVRIERMGRMAHALFDYQNGVKGILNIAPATGSRYERYAVHSQETSAYLKSAYHFSTDYPGEIEIHAKGKVSRVMPVVAAPDWEVTGIGNQARMLLNHILHGTLMGPTLTDSVETMRIAEKFK